MEIPSKICFYEADIRAKVTRNPTSKSMSEVNTKLESVHMDLWGPFPDILLQKKNGYMWTTTDQATGRLWTQFCRV